MFSFKISFPEAIKIETVSNDFEENGLGNFTTDIKEIEDANRKLD